MENEGGMFSEVLDKIYEICDSKNYSDELKDDLVYLRDEVQSLLDEVVEQRN